VRFFSKTTRYGTMAGVERLYIDAATFSFRPVLLNSPCVSRRWAFSALCYAACSSGMTPGGNRMTTFASLLPALPAILNVLLLLRKVSAVWVLRALWLRGIARVVRAAQRSARCYTPARRRAATAHRALLQNWRALRSDDGLTYRHICSLLPAGRIVSSCHACLPIRGAVRRDVGGWRRRRRTGGWRRLFLWVLQYHDWSLIFSFMSCIDAAALATFFTA